MRYQNIFFDLDGTLSDPEYGICESIRYALTKCGYEAEPRSSYQSWIGPPLLPSFKQHLGVDDAEAQRLLAAYRERFSTVGLFENEVYPGIPALLKELKEFGARLVVATGKPTVYSEQILDHFGLLPYFELVSGISLDSEPLDKRGVIEIGLHALGDPPLDTCVMIGDRCHDVQGAKLCGISSIAVLYGYGDRTEAETAGADRIASSVAELREFLLG